MDPKKLVEDDNWRNVIKKIKPEFPDISNDELTEMIGMIYRGNMPVDTTHEIVNKVKKNIAIANGEIKLNMTFSDKATIIIEKNENVVDILKKIRRKIDSYLPYNFETANLLALEVYSSAWSDIERYRSYAIDMLVEWNWNNIEKNVDNSKNQKVIIEIPNTLHYTGWMILNLNRKSMTYYEEFMEAYFDDVVDELSNFHYDKQEVKKAMKKAYFKNPEFIGRDAKEIAEKTKTQLKNRKKE